MNPEVEPDELWPPRYSDCRIVQSDDGVEHEAEVFQNAEAFRDAAVIQTTAIRATECNNLFQIET